MENLRRSIEEERMCVNVELDLILEAFSVVDDRHLNERKEVNIATKRHAFTFRWHLKVVELFGNNRIIIFIQGNQGEDIFLVRF